MYNKGKQANIKITAILFISIFWYYTQFKSGKTVYKQINLRHQNNNQPLIIMLYTLQLLN